MATTESSHDEPVPSAEEPKNTTEWCIDIMKVQQGQLTVETEKQDEKPRSRLQVQKVKESLRRKSDKECFDPLVVSLGPFHHGKEPLKRMEHHKNVAAAWFISLATDKNGQRASTITASENIIAVYQKFKDAVESSPINFYADREFFHEPKFRSDSEDWMVMMFLDGCFILRFIHLVVNGWSDDLSNSNHLIPKHIVRDMFLLENQIPYQILSVLMNLMVDKKDLRVWIMEFIFRVVLPPFEFNFSVMGCWRVLFVIYDCLSESESARDFHLADLWERIYGGEIKEPIHLLDLLRAVLIGGGASPNTSHESGHWNYYFRPITELAAAGIQVSRGNSWILKDVKFKKGPINSHLVLPQIVVDDSTETRLLNLLAYEEYSGPLNRTVTSYVCFLDSLIQNTEDVKELHCKKILLNRLDSNEEVNQLFKKLAADLSPDYKVYTDVIKGIGEHSRRHFDRERVQIGQWMSQLIVTYFTTPWTIISFIAAILLLFLTLLQTIYTMLGFYET